MKVKELLEFLKNQNQELRVVVTGYEGGYNDAISCVIRKLSINENADMWYYGPHDVISDEDIKPETVLEDAILICR